MSLKNQSKPLILLWVGPFTRERSRVQSPGINFFTQEVVAKRLGLLHELVPKAARVAVLVNPANASNADSTLREVQEAARVLGLQLHVLDAGTSGEIDSALITLVRERANAT